MATILTEETQSESAVAAMACGGGREQLTEAQMASLGAGTAGREAMPVPHARPD